MTKEQIMKMQKRIDEAGFPLVVDGFWGPRSQRACRLYLRSLMPTLNPWPIATQRQIESFYGRAGDESQLVRIEFPYPMFYEGKRVTSTRVHRKCSHSLQRILKAIGDKFPQYPSIVDEAEDFSGVYNFRLKRGGSSYSLHAYGAAIDLDADDNSFKDSWPMQSDMPLEIIEEFAKEGWTSAAAFWGYDAMHFQATQP